MAAFTPTTNPRPTVGTGDGCEETTAVAAGTYTATASQEFVVLGDCQAIELQINFTKVGAAPSVVFSVSVWDVASSTWISILSSAAVVATGTASLLVGSQVPTVANVSTSRCLRRLMRVTATHGNTDDCTYSITVVGN